MSCLAGFVTRRFAFLRRSTDLIGFTFGFAIVPPLPAITGFTMLFLATEQPESEVQDVFHPYPCTAIRSGVDIDSRTVQQLCPTAKSVNAITDEDSSLLFHRAPSWLQW